MGTVDLRVGKVKITIILNEEKKRTQVHSILLNSFYFIAVSFSFQTRPERNSKNGYSMTKA